MKRILALILFVALLSTSVFGLASCKKDKGGKSDEINYEIDLNQKPTLEILMPNSGRLIEEVNADPNAKLIEQLTGYKVNYTQLPADAANTLNTTFLDEKPYHAIKLTKDQFSDLVNDELLTDITDALSVYAPDILANISEESWEVVTVDGRIYGIPERASSDNIENPIILNYDLMLELSLDVPETLDEFTEVLRAMTAKLGKPALTFDQNTPLVYAISAAFGIYSYWQEYDINGTKEVRFYMDAPGYADYVAYMHSLYAEGLIDKEVSTNAAADANNRFVNGFKADAQGAKAGAYATSLWSVSAIVTALEANKIISATEAKGELDNYLAYVRSLKKNASDPERVYRSGGYTYITAIPFYMASEAGYTLDWMNSKIKDTAEADNFRQMVIGTEGTHWRQDADGNYLPIDPAFAEKDEASYFMTGSNENKYTSYWLARVRKQPELFRAWSELMADADKVGEKNIVDFTPPIEDYNNNRASVEIFAQNSFYQMLKEGTDNLDSLINELNNQKGGKKATDAINEWYKSSN